MTAAHVLLADVTRERIDAAAELFPALYRKSWRLTRIVATYMVGQILRSDPELEAILADPATALADRSSLDGTLDKAVKVVAATLKQRADERMHDAATDDFNVEFKREAILKELGVAARKNFILVTTTGGFLG